MRVHRLMVNGFRNLQDFSIDFDAKEFATVLIGENGTGKSNLIEAIVLVFRDLDLGEYPEFSYTIEYECRRQSVRIEGHMGKRQRIWVDTGDGPARWTWKRFKAEKDAVLPKYVFAYYSGPSDRLKSYFDAHQKLFYDAILRDKDGSAPMIRRLFYCLPEHSRWVLLAYFLRGQGSPAFLKTHFGIDSFDSALLVLRRPRWAKNWSEARPPPADIRRLGDPRFWWARGVVKHFLGHVWNEALAPIAATEDHQEDYRASSVREERLYLYLKDVEALRNLSGAYPDEAALFAALESTDISELIRDVRVRVSRAGESIVLSEMSEGEQQLLTVVGLMQFTKHDESLFLLDEPDTHLNPHWKVQYLEELSKQAGFGRNDGSAGDSASASVDRTSQLLLTTHDPLTIAGLRAGQVRIFERGASENLVRVRTPEVDPRGMGVAGVLIRMFGLDSGLDRQTQALMQQRDNLSRVANPTVEQLATLRELQDHLDGLGLAYETRDPQYQRYLQGLFEWEREQERLIEELPDDEQLAVVASVLAQIQEADQ